jgi:cytochrome c-type biogenesis protein CcmH
MENATFWLVAGALTLAVAAILVRAGLRAQAAAPAAEADMAVYRDQLAEIDRDIARGLIPPEDAQRLRTEVARRLLDADRAAQGATGAARGGFAAGAGAIALLMAGGAATYLVLGAPGYPDLPLALRIAMAEERRETRPAQAEAEAGVQLPAMTPDPAYAALMDRLRAAVAADPGNTEGLALLAVNEFALGNLDAARDAQTRLIAAKGDGATGDDHALLAQMMIAAAGGYVSPEAEAELELALARDPQQPDARYFAGLMMAQVGRFDMAFRLWAPLFDDVPDAPWMAALRDQMPGVAARAGVDFALPEAPGPTAEQMAAAGDMAPEDRQAMIAGMVEGLSARLATEGGPPADWARLITSLGVLGQTEQARAIWTEAQSVFATDPGGLAAVNDAAAAAGLVP